MMKSIFIKIDFLRSHKSQCHFVKMKLYNFFIYNIISLVILHVKVLSRIGKTKRRPDRQEVSVHTLIEVIFFAISYLQIFKMLLASFIEQQSKFNL